MRSGQREAEGTPGEDVRFRVLGPLEVRRHGVDRAPSTPKVLQLLAVLLMRPGRMVHIDTLIRELWSDNPPRTVRATLHTYVHHLRRCLDAKQPAKDPDEMLITRQSGYALQIDPAWVDVHDFGVLQHVGDDRRARGDHAGAADSYRAALDLWSGAPLANLYCGPILSAYRTELAELRRNVLHLRIEAEIAGGHHRELIGELHGLATDSPLDEALHGQLMRALGRSGRRSDAMTVYRGLRSRLAGELGVEPCDEIQLLHRALITEGSHH
ncbi:AfsR/SARP family transcriptional regulator [Amycolatopsis sp. NBC_01480]|uniref:AfsR/SARP family transcriptional regulator n=1 Tax=Amycolatopsis sp. NBC_01480 TaxID=2903562 RepID=UPI002E2E6808|nr:AfsR/SARP family transcriptional regulator [Amycolatopsis sp. NBC_01480]